MFSTTDGSPCGADLAYEGPANQRRGRPDQLSKIVFQWQARRQPLRLAQLIQEAAEQAGVDEQAAGKLGAAQAQQAVGVQMQAAAASGAALVAGGSAATGNGDAAMND